MLLLYMCATIFMQELFLGLWPRGYGYDCGDLRALVYISAVRCGCGLNVCGAVRCGAGLCVVTQCGAVRLRASVLRCGVVAGLISRPAQTSNLYPMAQLVV